MKNYRMIILAVLLTMVCRTVADNLTVETIKMSAGETKQVAIVLNNPTHQYAAFQFDLVLPEGICIAENDKGKFIASLNENRKDDHTLNVSEMGANTYRFLAFSMTNTEFYGTDGTLVYITLQADDGISKGNKTAIIQSQVFTEVSGEQYKWSNNTFQITIEAVVVPITITAQSYTREYGEDNPTFEFTVTDGTISSGTPTITCSATKTSPVGTYDILIEKGTVSNNAVALVNGTLTIVQAPLTVTANSFTITQGDAMPAFTASYSGFRNGNTASVLNRQPKFTCSATSSSTPGTYDIIVSDAEAKNYSMNYVKGTLTIEKRTDPVITVIADDKTMAYGDNVPTLTYKVNGGTLTGTPKLSTTATRTTDVGSYTIKVEAGSVAYSNLELINGTLTITQAPLTVTANSFTITQGDAMPVFTASYSGFRNGNTESVLTKQPKFSCSATSSSTPGTYDIIVSDAEAKNYSMNYVKGTLTIIKKETTTPVEIADWPHDVIAENLPAGDYTDTALDNWDYVLYTSSAKASDALPIVNGLLTTGNETAYAIDPSKKNSLVLKATNTPRTLNFTTPAKCEEIRLIAISAEGTASVEAVVNYVDGTDAPVCQFTVDDWYNTESGHGEAVYGFDRINRSSNEFDLKPYFRIFEFTISTDADKIIKGITFTNTSSAIPTILGIAKKGYDAPVEIVTADDKTMAFGDNVPELTYKVRGGTLTGIPSLSTTATKTSDVGTYPIMVKAGSVTNSNVIYVDGTLTITQAPLTVTATSFTITQGDALPDFSATYSGFRNGNTASVLTKQPKFTCSATSSSAPGIYDIIVSEAEAKNYSITYVKGTLTIQEKTAETSSWYNDVIAEGIPVNNYTDETLDWGGWCFYTPEVRESGALPIVNGKLKTNNGTLYDINPAAKNSIVLRNANESKTFNFTTPCTCEDIYILAISTQGDASLNTVIQYEDGSTGTAQQFTISDWYSPQSGQGEVIYGLGRINLSDDSFDENNLFRLFEFKLSANKSKKATGITFTSTGSAIPTILGVTKGVTVTAEDKTMAFGDNVPELTYKVSGGTLTGRPNLSTTATKTSDVGTYPIMVKAGSVTNSNVIYVDGTLTITQAPLTVTANSFTITQGDAMPAFSATYIGFRNGNTESVLTKQPKFTCSATSSSTPGTYDIIVSDAEAKNYSMNYVKGTLTIIKKETTTPVEIADWPHDVIAENLPAGDYTDTALDNWDYVLYTSSAKASDALPIVNGLLTTSNGTAYAIDPSKKNSLVLKATNTPRTLNFTTPAKCEEIRLIAISAEGAASVEAVVNYVDGTNAPVYQFSVDDWYNTESGHGEAVYGFERINRSSNEFDLKPYFRIFEFTISTDADKIVKGITFKNTSSAIPTILGIAKKGYDAPVEIVTADDKTMAFGDNVPELTYKVRGGTLTGRPNLSTTATKTSDVGTYPIMVKAGSVTNSNVIYVDGTLTVTQAPLTVTANSFTITQGDAMPAFTATYSGFRNGNTESVLTKKPKFTCSANSSSTPGTYDIIVSDAEAKNYSMNYVKGTLTVIKKDTTTPVEIADWPHDVIAENLPAGDYTDTALDNWDYVLYTSSAKASDALPIVNGLLTTSNGTAYAIDPSKKNSLVLKATNTPRTLNFTTPTKCEEIRLIAISAEGAASVEAVVNYVDGTDAPVCQFTVDDWYNTESGHGEAVYGFDRINRSSNEFDLKPYFRIFEFTISTDADKIIKGITFTNTSSAIPTILGIAKKGYDAPVEMCTVTYAVRYDGKVVATATEKVAKGNTLPVAPASLTNDFVTLTKSGTHPTTVTKDVSVYFTATWNGPFEFSKTLSDAKWYNMHIRSGYYVSKTDSEPYYPKMADETERLEPAYLWAFGGDPYHVKVYNYTTGFAETLTKVGENAVVRKGDYTWDLLPNNGGFVLRVTGTENTCINQFGNNSGPLQFWTNGNSLTDDGSTFRVEDVTPLIDGIEFMGESDTSAPIYDLSGRRVSAPIKKGIFIINRKKVLVE